MLIKSIVVGIARAGSDKTVVKADYLSGLKSYEFGEIPHVIVVPGELHFLEKEGAGEDCAGSGGYLSFSASFSLLVYYSYS